MRHCLTDRGAAVETVARDPDGHPSGVDRGGVPPGRPPGNVTADPSELLACAARSPVLGLNARSCAPARRSPRPSAASLQLLHVRASHDRLRSSGCGHDARLAAIVLSRMARPRGQRGRLPGEPSGPTVRPSRARIQDADLGRRIGALRHLRNHPDPTAHGTNPPYLGARKLWWPTLTAFNQGVQQDPAAFRQLIAQAGKHRHAPRPRRTLPAIGGGDELRDTVWNSARSSARRTPSRTCRSRSPSSAKSWVTTSSPSRTARTCPRGTTHGRC